MASSYKLTNLSTTQGSKVRVTQMGLDKRLRTQLHAFLKRAFVVWWLAGGAMSAERGRSGGTKGSGY